MSEQEHGSKARLHPLLDIGPSTSNDSPGTTADRSITASGGSATANGLSVATHVGPSKADSSSASKSSARTRFTAAQVAVMEKEFRLGKPLTSIRREEIAREIQLTESQVKSWFNRRKMRQKEEREEAKRSTPYAPPLLPPTSNVAQYNAIPHYSINANQWAVTPYRIHPYYASNPTFQFIEKWLTDQPAVNQSQDPDLAQLGEARDRRLFPNLYREVNESRNGAPRQQQPDVQQADRDRSPTLFNPDTNHDPSPVRIVEVKSDAQKEFLVGGVRETERGNARYAGTRIQWYRPPS